MTKPKTDERIDFEHILAQLQTAVHDLEKGNLPLEQALDKFQEAMTLSKKCQQALQQAELRISQLTEDGTVVQGIDTASTS